MMARTRAEIKKQITDTFMSNPTMANKYGFAVGESFTEKFSVVSFENILFEILSFILSFHEQMVAENAENSRVHTLSWYRNQVLNFIDGAAIKWINGQFEYDTAGMSDEDIAAAKIVKKCAVVERARGGLLIKITGEDGPLPELEFNRVKYAMELLKDAGNRISWRNDVADDLLANIDVYVDPMLINLSTGKLINSTEEIYPVKDAINAYLDELEFNGALVKTKLIDAIQSAVGVKDVHVNSLTWRYGTNPFAPITRIQIPYSGHFSFGENLTLNFKENDLG